MTNNAVNSSRASVQSPGFSNNAKVSVIIVNWNAERFLEQCLAALMAQTVPPHEIILVDNASSDRSVEIVRRDIGAVNICSGAPISVRRLVEQWLYENNWEIELNLGYYPYPDYEPMAFWGEPLPESAFAALEK